MGFEQPRHVKAPPYPGDALVVGTDYYNTSVRLPVPIHERLVAMQRGALDEGVRASMSDILAALVAFADPSDDAVAGMIRNYHKTTVSELDPDHNQSD